MGMVINLEGYERHTKHGHMHNVLMFARIASCLKTGYKSSAPGYE
jgi:hypothetical protein